MYLDFFGLAQPPFKITPNTDFFFAGGKRGAILEALAYAITHGEGIIKVTGEVGSGKTMLCRMLQSRLPPDIEIVYIANPTLRPEEILHAISFELQLDLPHGASRLQVMQVLHQHLLDLHMQGRQAVVFVEESQGMPIPTLEELRLLSNLETQQHKLLQIVLFGQPELDDNLREANIRQLRERITHSFHLGPLSAREIQEYLMFRMRAAGYHGPELFSPAVAAHIARSTGGLTRRVNIVADKILLAAFADNTHTIRLKHVRAALKDCEFGAAAPLLPRWAGLTAAVAGGIAFGYGWNHLAPQLQAPPQPMAALQQAVAPAHLPASVPLSTAVSAVFNTPVAVPAEIPLFPDLDLADAKLLEQRIQAAREILEKEPGGKFSIELFVTDDVRPLRMEGFLKRAEKSVKLANVYVFPISAGGRTRFRVTYGVYATREEGADVITRMPEKYKQQFDLKLRSLEEISQAEKS
ncbi:MAG: AAA family ATPase [Pseudomonadota bacterium]